jgi:hypothetical protein
MDGTSQQHLDGAGARQRKAGAWPLIVTTRHLPMFLPKLSLKTQMSGTKHIQRAATK